MFIQEYSQFNLKIQLKLKFKIKIINSLDSIIQIIQKKNHFEINFEILKLNFSKLFKLKQTNFSSMT